MIMVPGLSTRRIGQSLQLEKLTKAWVIFGNGLEKTYSVLQSSINFIISDESSCIDCMYI